MSTTTRAALFDLDRTLVSRDTASLYTRFQREIGDASAWDTVKVGWWVAKYTLGVIDAERIARKVALGYGGKTEQWMQQRGERCYREYVRQYVTDEARRVVESHQKAGNVLAIATSGTPYIAGPLAQELGIEHIVCTRMEVRDGVLTGRIVDPLCYGRGKLMLARRFVEGQGLRLEDAYFYTDSITDLPLLECVRVPVAVNPDARLMRHASKLDWRIEHWR